MGGVFINYRSDDQPFVAAWIHDHLARRFGAERVFRDIVSMKPGEHYPTELRRALERSDVLVAVIGPGWADLRDASGERRIWRETDWVHREIAYALEHEMVIVPVVLKNAPGNASPPREDQLPERLRGFALEQAFEFDQRHLPRDMDALSRLLVEKVPELAIADLFLRPPAPRSPAAAPSTLLLPEYRLVTFSGRDEELADLRSWATGSAACSARLVLGPAGSGKTRLAQQLCDELVKREWLAGLVSGRAPAAQIRHASAIDRPLLVAVDDVETNPDQLVALAGALGQRSPLLDAPARLLLLGRCEGSWLEALRQHPDPRVAEIVGTITARTTVHLAAGVPDRSGQWRAARTAFASALGIGDDSGTAPAPPQPVDGTESVEDLHLAALLDLLAARGRRPTTSAAPGRAQLLRHDRGHLRRALAAGGRGTLDTRGVAIVATVATLCRPGSTEEAEALVGRLPNFLGETTPPVGAYVDALADLYPGPFRLAALRPTSFGEQVVADTMAAVPTLAATLAVACTDEQVLSALTVLGRALPAYGSLGPAIVDLVRAAPQRVVDLCVDVAARLPEPEPFNRTLGEAIRGRQLPVDLLFSLLDRLGSARQQELDPFRAHLLRAFVDSFALPFVEEMRGRAGLDASPLAAKLLPLADRARSLLLDGFAGVMDPSSGSMPRLPDGQPLLSPRVAEAVRKVLLTGDWLGRPPKDRP